MTGRLTREVIRFSIQYAHDKGEITDDELVRCKAYFRISLPNLRW